MNNKRKGNSGKKRALKMLLGLLLLMVSAINSPLHAQALSPEQLLPVVNGLDAFSPAAGYGDSVYLLVWQSGKFDTGSIENGLKPIADLVGCRVDRDGNLLDATPFVICNAIDLQERPQIAFANGVFMVVWQDLRNTKDWDIYAARVTPQGVVLDPNGIALTAQNRNQALPRITWEGHNFWVVWQDFRSGTNYEVYGGRISTAGVVLDGSGTLLISRLSYNQDFYLPVPASAGNGRSFNMCIASYPVHTEEQVWFRVQDGQLLDTIHDPATAVGGTKIGPNSYGCNPVSLAASPTNYMAVWRTNFVHGRGAAVSSVDASLIDIAGRRTMNFRVSTDEDRINLPDVIWDNIMGYISVWQEDGADLANYGIDNKRPFDVVRASRFTADGEPIGGFQVVSGTRENPAGYARVASDNNGSALIAYERHPATADVPIKIGYRMLGIKFDSVGYIKVSLLDSASNTPITTSATAKLLLSGVQVGTLHTSSKGVFDFQADSGSDYTVNITATGYVSKSAPRFAVTRGTVTRITVLLTKQPVVGIAIEPQELFLYANEQKQLAINEVCANGDKILNNGSLTPVWTSRNNALVSVSTSGLAASNTQYGSCTVVAQVASLGFSDSITVKVMKRPLGNAGFESPVTANYQYTPADSYWVFSAGSGIQHNRGEFNGPDAPEGAQTAFLQNVSSIKQQISLDAGFYKVKFQVSGRNMNTATQTVKVYLDSLEIGSVTPASVGFREFATDTFTVSAGSYQLKFAGAAATGDNTAFIDDVGIMPGSYTDNEPEGAQEGIISLGVAPNPFNPSVAISVSFWKPGAELKILNINGKVASNLTKAVNSRWAGRGVCRVEWNASGHASGVYIVVLKNGKEEIKRKITLIR